MDSMLSVFPATVHTKTLRIKVKNTTKQNNFHFHPRYGERALAMLRVVCVDSSKGIRHVKWGLKPQSPSGLGKPFYILETRGPWVRLLTHKTFHHLLTLDFSMVRLTGIWGQFCCGIKFCVKNSSWY